MCHPFTRQTLQSFVGPFVLKACYSFRRGRARLTDRWRCSTRRVRAVPQGAFGTTALIATDGLFCTGVAKPCVVGERHHTVRCST
jgi:hypothetical protein